MNCEEFRTKLHERLDRRAADQLPEPMRLHAAECAECRKFQAEMSSLEVLLARAPKLAPSPELVASLHAIAGPESRPEFTFNWGKEIRRIAIWVVPSCAVFAVAQLFPDSVQLWLNFALAFFSGVFWWGGVVGMRHNVELI